MKLSFSLHLSSKFNDPSSLNLEDLIIPIGSSGTPYLDWLDKRQRNKLTHIIFGNRGQRGKGINGPYWNKGPAHLVNKQLDIETIIGNHKPQILRRKQTDPPQSSWP